MYFFLHSNDIIYTAAKIPAKQIVQEFPSAQCVTLNQKEFSSLFPLPLSSRPARAAATAYSMPIER